MKICILSMQRDQHMGSLLQAYALKHMLESLGAVVEFIDIKRIESDNMLLGNFALDYSAEREKNTILTKLNIYLPYRIINHLAAKEQNELFEMFRKNELNIDSTSKKYDLCIIGSDEVFNCLTGEKWGFSSQLFGNVPEAERVITYAASCGATEFKMLPLKVADRIRESFENVVGFSVRDKNTYEFVNALTNQKIQFNLDPVLIYDFGKDIDQCTLPKLPKRFCIIYSYANRINKSEDIEALKTFLKKRRLTPIALGAPQYWIRRYITCSPFECLKIFGKAEFVFTDTFHGTIFSAKYAKRFAVMIRDSNNNKLGDLIERIGMQKHQVKNLSELNAVYEIEKEYTEFENVIIKEKNNAVDYLKGYMS